MISYLCGWTNGDDPTIPNQLIENGPYEGMITKKSIVGVGVFVRSHENNCIYYVRLEHIIKAGETAKE